jgi:hypothetical protein
MDRRIAQDKIIGFALGLGKQDRTSTGSDFSGKAVGLTIGKTDLNATYKTIGAKTALLLVFITNMR